MKTLLTIFILFISLTSQAQDTELKIIYDYVNHAVKNTHHMELRAKDDVVLSYTIRMVKTGPRKANTYKLTADSTLLYKDYASNYLQYEERLGQEQLVMEEDLKLFKWTKIRERDSILTYPCRTAIAEFRGREYKAYYTTKLKHTAAPWKFHGLPGVVLKVCSIDDVVSYQARSIELIEDGAPITNPFEGEKTISFGDFSKKYRAYHRDVVKMRRKRAAQQGRAMPEFNTAPRVEIIIPDNRFILNTD